MTTALKARPKTTPKARLKTMPKPKTKKKYTFSKYDAAEYIDTKEAVIVFLECALEEGNPDLLLRTIGNIVRSKGLTQIARELKVARTTLYRSLVPDGNPSFRTVFKLIDLLGLKIKFVPKKA